MKFLKQSFVLLLSLMVFLTSSGLTVNLHYCAGELEQVSLQKDHKNCMMEMNTVIKNCESKTSNFKSNLDCCQNHQIIAKGDTKITKVKEDNLLIKSYAVVKTYFISLFSFDSEEDDHSQDSSNNHSLFPILKEGLYILLQNFRN